MQERWSTRVSGFFNRILTVNLISCTWVIWAVISAFTFFTFLSSKLVRAFGSKGLDAFLVFGEKFKELLGNDELFVKALLIEVLFGGILAAGWLTIKIFYFVLDKIQQVFSS